MNIFLASGDQTRPEIVNIVLEFKRKGHDIVYWICNGKAGLPDLRKVFSEIQFHDNGDAIRGLPPEEIDEAEFAPPGEDLISNFYEIESILSTMKKFYILSDSTLKRKHIFHRLLQYWYGIINKFRPDVIFFSGYPHSVYDFVIYFIAKWMGIKTIFFEFTGILDRYLLATDIRIGSVALKEACQENQRRQYKVEDLGPDLQKYYQWHMAHQVGAVQPALEESINKFSGFNFLLLKSRVIFKSIGDGSFLKKFIGHLFKKFQSNLKKEYIKLQVKPDFNKKFIYVAISFQPECSTSPLGGVFVDQLLMIKILSFCLPPDWVIYVKEHPYQWLPHGLSYFNFRYKGYYKEIAEIKNVKLIPVETNSFELISQSQAVCTVTGSAGWEAVLRNKPVLLFGHIWYRDCPGVFKVNNVESCRQAIQNIQAGIDIINKQSLINYLVSLDRVSYHLAFEEAAMKDSTLDVQEFTRNYFAAINKEIQK